MQEKIMAMATMAFGGREALMQKPRVLTLVNTLSPLQIDRIALENFLMETGMDTKQLSMLKEAAARS